MTAQRGNSYCLGPGFGICFYWQGWFPILRYRVADFLVGGGIILLVLSINDLVTGKVIETRGTSVAEMVGVVPLGTPLIVGPAVLTTLLVPIEQYFVIIVAVSFVLNLLIQWLLLRQANRVVGFLGNTGVTAISKIVMLLLAAIAVRMVRQGIVAILG